MGWLLESLPVLSPVEAMEVQSWDALLTIVILFAFAAALGAVFERFRQSAIVGYLLAGALVGPGGLNWVSNPDTMAMLAELGVALLLFTIGLEFSLTRLRALGAFAGLGGTLQILFTAALFGGMAALAGLPVRTAVVIGFLAAPSSTACVLRILRDRAELDSVHGRAATGVLLLQDLALVPMVLFMTALAGGETDQITVLKEIGLAILLFGLLVAVFYGISAWLLPRILHTTALLRNRELLILVAAPLALGSAWAAHELNISPALGAFLAGLMLAGSPFAAQIRADVSALRILFVTLFFTSIGMLADLGWIGDNLGLVIVITVVLVVGKAVVVAPLARAFRFPWAHSVGAALCLAQVGEFSFVLGDIARRGNILADWSFHLVVSAALTTMLITPLLVALAPRVGQWIQAGANRRRRALAEGKGLSDTPLSSAAQTGEGTDAFHRGHVIVIGYGPTGREVVSALLAQGMGVSVVELNPTGVHQARRDGVLETLLGDATHEEILDHAGLRGARALVVTIPDHQTSRAIVRQAVATAPNVPVFARARYNKYASELAAAGAHVTVDEEHCVGRELGMRLVQEITGA